MASVRGIQNIQSLNELTSEKSDILIEVLKELAYT